MCDEAALRARKTKTSLLRSQVDELIRQMGMDPEDVVQVEIKRTHVVLWHTVRNPDGTVKLDSVGPRVSELYRSIENDVARKAGGTSTGDRCT